MKYHQLSKNITLSSILIIFLVSCSPYKNSSDDDKYITKKHINTEIHNNYSNEDISLHTRNRIKFKKLNNNIVYFDLDQYSIRSEFIWILDKNAKILCKNPTYKVRIEGHADERGSSEYNIALGERRANTLKTYLQSKGVFYDQISILSYGKEKPAVFGHDEKSYEKNRRAVLVYLK